MRFYHATSKSNIRSICRHGLLTSKAKTKAKMVWLHSSFMSSWAIAHVAERHGVDPRDVVIVAVDVPDGDVVNGSRPGIHMTKHDIAPGNIAGFYRLSFRDVTRNVIESSRGDDGV